MSYEMRGRHTFSSGYLYWLADEHAVWSVTATAQ